VTAILKERALTAGYWAFWCAMYTLGFQQGIYLLQGHGRWDWALSAGVALLGARWWVAVIQEDNRTRERSAVNALIKLLLLRSGPVKHSIYGLHDPKANPTFAVIVDETVGIANFSANLPATEITWVLNRILPRDVAVHLGQWGSLDEIDQHIVSVSRRIGNADRKNLLHDIRVVILRELYRRADRHDSDPYLSALSDLILEVPRLSPIYRLLDAVRMECRGHSSVGIRIGTWEIVESWLEQMPPKKFEDLCGGDGRPLPPIPKAIEDALKPQPPGTTYTSKQQ